MTASAVFTGSVTRDGRLLLDARTTFRCMVRTLSGQAIELVIRRRRRARSTRQCRYYWGVVVAMLAEACGYTPDELHDGLKWKFLRHQAESALPTVRSTTDLTTTEFEEFLETVRAWAATDLNVHIPLPNEVTVPTRQAGLRARRRAHDTSSVERAERAARASRARGCGVLSGGGGYQISGGLRLQTPSESRSDVREFKSSAGFQSDAEIKS